MQISITFQADFPLGNTELRTRNVDICNSALIYKFHQLLPAGLAQKAPAGLLFLHTMPQEPTVKRAVSFFDGQNLFRHAKEAFGYYHPNYDPGKLAAAVCVAKGWSAAGVRFYTGVPEAEHSQMWHG